MKISFSGADDGFEGEDGFGDRERERSFCAVRIGPIVFVVRCCVKEVKSLWEQS
jgi:hypothetical protein